MSTTRGLKRTREPSSRLRAPSTRSSKIALPAQFKRLEKPSQLDKENDAPAEACADAKTTKKPRVTRSRKGLSPVAGENTAVTTAPPAPVEEVAGGGRRVQAAAEEDFDEGTLDAAGKALKAKTTAGKFEYTERLKQALVIQKALKLSLKQVLDRKDTFVHHCRGIERHLEAEAEEYRLSVAVTLEGSLATQTALQQATAACAASTTSLDALTQQHAAAQAEAAGLSTRLTELTAELQAATASGTEQGEKIETLSSSLAFRTSSLSEATTALEGARRGLAEAQVSARAELSETKASLGQSLEEAKVRSFELEQQLGERTAGKKAAEQELALARLEVVQHAGEAQRATERLQAADRDVERERERALELQTSLTEKSAELTKALSAFTSAQSFNEGRHGAMAAEVSHMRTSNTELRETKRNLEEAGRDAARTIETLQAELTTIKAHAEQTQLTWQQDKEEWTAYKGSMEAEQAALLAAHTSTTAATAAAHTHALQAVRAELTAEVEARDTQLALLKLKAAAAATAREEAAAAADAEARAQQEQCERAREELSTFRANSGVSDSEQLQNLCKLTMEVEVLRRQAAGKADLASELADQEHQIQALKQAVFHGETNRRELHNKIQELRGNVRTIIRVRPFLPCDKEASPAFQFHPNGRGLVLAANEKLNHKFSYDKVFPCESGQQQVFEEVQQLVQSALDGFNVCLYSYGQTGSGKTFTMQGCGGGDDRGIIPRSVEQVLSEAERLTEQGWVYTLEATFVEIYNETLRDLLGHSASVDIKLDKSGQVHVPGLQRVAICTSSEIDTIMSVATKARAVAKTEMNARSSRSHSIFSLHIVGHNLQQGVEVKGTLNLCDLAGSERLSRSGATGDRLKETQAINKSLSALGDVFQAITTKSKHVPYRNSKLTHLLQPCFSGQGKTLMFVNLAPGVNSHDESLCSLRFASKVNNAELGRSKPKATKRPSTAR